MSKREMSIGQNVVRALKGVVHRLGWEVSRRRDGEEYPSDFSPDDIKTIEAVRPYTMTGSANIFALVRAVEYIAGARVPGDIVECGVWRGGSMMAVAKTLLRLGAADRNLYLYDTFEGMTAPTVEDSRHDSVSAQQRYAAMSDSGEKWCYASEEEVRHNLLGTGYPPELLHFVRGPVEKTLLESAPNRISLLRLDTDWYESTKVEFEQLYPKLAERGVLIVDDYGHWRGARKATDEYFAAQGIVPLLVRVDYTSRIVLKT